MCHTNITADWFEILNALESGLYVPSQVEREFIKERLASAGLPQSFKGRNIEADSSDLHDLKHSPDQARMLISLGENVNKARLARH